MMRIIVPSLGRAGVSPSAKWLKETKREVFFAVHPDEVEAYQKSYPWGSILSIPDIFRHHDGKLRKHLLDTNIDPYFSVDDDVRLSLKSVTTVDGMFDTLERHIECGATMAGIGQQLFSNAIMEKTVIVDGDPWCVRNKFASLVYGIDPKPYTNCDLPRLRIYGDIALAIHAIQYGGGTVISYCATHSNASPPSGGCNSWRTREIILQDLDAICEMYPGICEKRLTDATTHSQYIGVGLRVAWSKIKKLN